MKKVYFAGSIRGGREDADLYRELIAHIQEKHTVLTEHVGARDVFALEKHQTDRDIYEQDTNWIRACDLVIAECTRPSLGVGYELAFAEGLQKPCHLLYRGDKDSLSAMLSGDLYFHTYNYQTKEEAFQIIDAILKKEAE